MRPRFMNRGSGAHGLESEVPEVASMRPRFMNRGSPGEKASQADSRSGFNEAPIHESGK